MKSASRDKGSMQNTWKAGIHTGSLPLLGEMTGLRDSQWQNTQLGEFSEGFSREIGK